MANLTELGNLVNCGTGVALGTGGIGCETILQATTALWFTPRGFKYDTTVDFDQDYINQIKAEGKLIILKDIKEFTTNREENVKQTDGDGTISVTRKGLYAFNVKFQKGFEYQAALSSLDSFGVYDISFVDQNGSILGTTSNNGSLKGITTGMVDADGIDFATFSTRMMQGLTFQFLYPDEVNTDYYFISGKELTFKANRVDGVNEVVLLETVPVNASTTLTVKAKLKNGLKPFTGALFSDFSFKVNGVTNNPTGGDDSVTEGTYVLTGFTAFSTDDKVTYSLYNNTENRIGITIDQDVFKSNTVSTTVTLT